MKQTIQIEFYGPEMLKAAAFELINLQDGRFEIDYQRQLLFKPIASGVVVDTKPVDTEGELFLWRFDVNQAIITDIKVLFPEYDVINQKGIYHLSGRGQWPYRDLRQSYIADFKDAFEHKVGHSVFSRYLRHATSQYLDKKEE